MGKHNRGQTEEEKEAMGTKKKVGTVEKAETKERAAVGRERRLALALVAVLDANEDADKYSEAAANAQELMAELGYAGIESTAKRVTRINEELNKAITVGDGARIAELGKELQKAQAGKFHRAAQESLNGNTPSE